MRALLVVSFGWILLIGSSMASLGQTAPFCATRNLDDDGTPTDIRFQGAAQYGITVSLVPESDSSDLAGSGLTEGKLTKGLNDAIGLIEGANSPCASTANLPPLDVNSVAPRPQTPSPMERVTTLGIRYLRNDAPASGQVLLAEWTQFGGEGGWDTIEIYGKCPNNSDGLPDFCVGPTGNRDIDWSHPEAVKRLAHEILHAFGLGHDRQDGECSAQNGLMRDPLGLNSSLKTYHCELADYLNCEGDSCPQNPCPNPIVTSGASLGEKTICEPDDPIRDLPNLCDRVPELCRPNGPGGPTAPWWNNPTETGPTRVCTVVSTEIPGAGTVSETRCYFDFIVVQPINGASQEPPNSIESPSNGALDPKTVGATTNLGPMTFIQSPSGGAVVSGSVQVDGWSRDEDLGITGTLGFWVDRQSVYPTSVSYGDPDASACSGSTDPNCPYVGFSASLDTTQLADGSHTLEVVTAEAALEEPTPGYSPSTFTVDNTKPTVTITAPSPGAVLNGTTLVTANAADTYGISAVDLFIDGGFQVSDNTPPYSFSLSTTNWPDGAHVLRVRAWDKAGNARASQFSVTFANDLQTPQVSLSKPAAGALIRGSVTVEALATDDQGVSRVELYLDGGLLATDTTSPYRVTWNTTASADGLHSLTAKAFDDSGNVAVSLSVGVTVDNTAPTRHVDSPSHNQTVSGTAALISGWAIDASRVVSKTFTVDGQPLTLLGALQTVSRGAVCSAHPEVPDPNCPNVGWRGYFNSTLFANGSHTLTATFVDAAGNASTFNRLFVIANSQTASFNPVADATAWQVSPNNNTGTQTVLAVRTPSDGQGAYSFLKFEVTGVVGQVTSARLEVQTSTPMYDLWLYWLVHSSWTESNLTWNDFPGPGGDLDHFYNLASQTWYSFDVSAYVTGNGTYSLGFANSNPTYSYLYSRESSSKPVLEITYVP